MITGHHYLNIFPHYFQAVIDGRKTFEIRKNDRDFRSGDTISLIERNIERMHGVTGRQCSAEIGYITDYEQQPGYVVFSLLNVALVQKNHEVVE